VRVDRSAAPAGSTLSQSGSPPTEAREPGRDDLDLRSTAELVALMN
jgi:hypothetical protein